MLSNFPNLILTRFPEIDEVDEGLFSSALEHFFKKVSSSGEVQLTLSHKGYAKGGLKVQHEVHGQLKFNGKSFFASDNTWQLLESVQSVLRKLEKEVLKQHSKEQ